MLYFAYISGRKLCRLGRQIQKLFSQSTGIFIFEQRFPKERWKAFEVAYSSTIQLYFVVSFTSKYMNFVFGCDRLCFIDTWIPYYTSVFGVLRTVVVSQIGSMRDEVQLHAYIPNTYSIENKDDDRSKLYRMCISMKCQSWLKKQ